MIAALFVEKNGVYANLQNVEVWDISRDARKYPGQWPVICHPPCERWGRYWSGGPNMSAPRRLKGDDGGCFASALDSVRRWGGVLEHPEGSHAFREFGLGVPEWRCGWVRASDGLPLSWICSVAQGNYGHQARKMTWLYAYSLSKPPALNWAIPMGRRLDEGFHSKEERGAARAAGQAPRKRLSKAQNIATPIAFRDLLISIAESAS